MANAFKYFGIQDVFMSLLIFFIFDEVITKWRSYDTCEFPIQIYITVSWVVHLCMRTFMIVAQVLMDSRSALKIRAARTLMHVNVWVFLPFMLVWNSVGVFWYLRSESCIPHDAEAFWAVIVVLSLLYLMVYVYLIHKANQADEWINHFEVMRAGHPRFRVPVRRQDSDRIHRAHPDMRRQPSLEEINGHLRNARAWGFVPRGDGMSHEEIAALPTREVRADEDMDRQCSICLSELEVKEKTHSVQCGHLFHTACLEQWLARRRTCPNCRQEIVGQDSAFNHV